MLRKFKIKIDGVSYLVEMEEIGVENQPQVAYISEKPKAEEAPKPIKEEVVSVATSATSEQITSPMPGKILELLVDIGDSVIENQPLLILEAMKMENEIVASKGGKVINIAVSKNQTVDSGKLLLEIQ
ncbi:MAG: acetyl-CoA carboxylase biotin carboxyl carrier protein subunit [Streptococcaceae bacterium]|jgi:biotin carboxyl carrier protein|nr:acetyl-CoA carboxylase biotin carboxyl carrier protein subunit [Streptococcaceae bacterium]